MADETSQGGDTRPGPPPSVDKKVETAPDETRSWVQSGPIPDVFVDDGIFKLSPSINDQAAAKQKEGDGDKQ
ncbi:hypothetical protein [Mycolicibacterium aubagnense]|uniref:Uncharacterized protein n=1 Tax=Mycolicibacterium aubagnense TaxID=319707 RepID=A0ABM7I9U8_9MYCO|nr:hypothetical protein [Mycolicibacterium aubagnense]WGI34423.1 hypothetical protein QDT91_08825 [Mycolicibacterium aubagnense]BBX83711.1 hypothetical protein MAUB_15840 [Mycolicibacterium aubagnense]